MSKTYKREYKEVKVKKIIKHSRKNPKYILDALLDDEDLSMINHRYFPIDNEHIKLYNGDIKSLLQEEIV